MFKPHKRTDKEVILEKAEKIRYDSAGETFVATESGGCQGAKSAFNVRNSLLILKIIKVVSKGEVNSYKGQKQKSVLLLWRAILMPEIYLFKEGSGVEKGKKRGGRRDLLYILERLLFFTITEIPKRRGGEGRAEIEWKENQNKSRPGSLLSRKRRNRGRRKDSFKKVMSSSLKKTEKYKWLKQFTIWIRRFWRLKGLSMLDS